MNDIQTILILDDDNTTLALLTEILKMEGFDTITAGTIAEAREIINGVKFDLAVFDLNLPDGNGLDLCRKVKERVKLSDIPILFLSATTDVKDKVLGFEAGAVDYITKPFSRVEVVARIKTHLRLYKEHKSVIELQAYKLSQVVDFQKSMLPQSEQMPEAKFALFFKPLHEAGGDLCHVFSSGKLIHDYIVADVCGHSFGTAMSTSALYALLKQNCSSLYSPLEIINTINNVACSFLTNGQFITAIYARVNRKTNRLTIVNAGSPPAILLKNEGKAETLWNSGDVIGVFDSVKFDMLNIPVNKNDKLFLFSDAVLDAITSDKDKTDWNSALEYLSKVIENVHNHSLDEIVNKTAELSFVGGKALDDITIVGIEV